MAEFDTTGIVGTKTPTRMLWPKLDKPVPFMKNGKEVGKPKFKAAVALASDHPDLKRLKDAAIAVARAQWPGVKLAEVEWPFKTGADLGKKDGSKMSQQMKDFIADKAVISMSSQKQPLLGLMSDKGIHTLESPVEIERNLSKFYSGVEVIFETNFKAYDGSKGEKYVTAYVNAVVSYQRGDRLGGGKPLAQRFSGYVGQAVSEDPTGGDLSDDDIPF